MKKLQSLRRLLRGSPKYISNPVVFSYSTFVADYCFDYGKAKTIKNVKLADYWNSHEDRWMGFGEKEGQIAVDGSDYRKALDDAEEVIKYLTGARDVRLKTDYP